MIGLLSIKKPFFRIPFTHALELIMTVAAVVSVAKRLGALKAVAHQRGKQKVHPADPGQQPLHPELPRAELHGAARNVNVERVAVNVPIGNLPVPGMQFAPFLTRNVLCGFFTEVGEVRNAGCMQKLFRDNGDEPLV